MILSELGRLNRDILSERRKLVRLELRLSRLRQVGPSVVQFYKGKPVFRWRQKKPK